MSSICNTPSFSKSDRECRCTRPHNAKRKFPRRPLISIHRSELSQSTCAFDPPVPHRPTARDYYNGRPIPRPRGRNSSQGTDSFVISGSDPVSGPVPSSSCWRPSPDRRCTLLNAARLCDRVQHQELATVPARSLRTLGRIASADLVLPLPEGDAQLDAPQPARRRGTGAPSGAPRVLVLEVSRGAGGGVP